jgi:alcohol dehydrogenase class IV
VIAFTFDGAPARVVFGAGSFDRLRAEADLLQAGRIMLVSTPGRSGLVSRAADMLGSRVASVFDRAVVHVPEKIAESARRAAQDARADCLVTLGGGSAIGAAKAVAIETEIPIIAVATTYGGSEMTPVYGFTGPSGKTTGRDERVRPRVVIYDPDLTLDLPSRITACSGLNAIAHCVEALYAPDANPLTSAAALEGFTLMSRALPVLAARPADREMRDAALQAAFLAGFALASVQMGLHHKLCHVVGGAFGLPHADTHAVLLPYTAAFNSAALPVAMGNAAESLLRLSRESGAPSSLRELGMSRQQVGSAAGLAVQDEYPNPRPVTREAIEELLDAAWSGDGSYVLRYR